MLYEFKIDNNGDGVEDITYQIRFTTQTRNSDTFLYNTGPIKALDDPNRNFYQTYTLTRIENGRTVLTAGPMLTMPDNVGPASTPSYGGNGSGIYEYTEASGGKGRVFAGQTDEAFFSDLAQAASVVRLTGRVPAGASDITFAYGLAMGSYALNVRVGDSPLQTLWLEGSGPSVPVSLVAPPPPATWTEIARQYFALGYTHILPRGIDHLLFVVGIFLLSARWRAILLQVSTFTLIGGAIVRATAALSSSRHRSSSRWSARTGRFSAPSARDA